MMVACSKTHESLIATQKFELKRQRFMSKNVDWHIHQRRAVAVVSQFKGNRVSLSNDPRSVMLM
jgi:hypothetical protein